MQNHPTQRAVRCYFLAQFGVGCLVWLQERVVIYQRKDRPNGTISITWNIGSNSLTQPVLQGLEIAQMLQLLFHQVHSGKSQDIGRLNHHGQIWALK